MNFFETVKQTVTTRQAAERYGLSVNRGGMARCPFHEDHHPSMKVDDRFYCFGCGARGDVIDFTARLFGVGLKDAATKLAADFGDKPRPPTKVNIPKHDAEPPWDRERLCICTLQEYLRHLRIWQLRYRPEKPGDKFHPRFAEAMKLCPQSITFWTVCWEMICFWKGRQRRYSAERGISGGCRSISGHYLRKRGIAHEWFAGVAG